MISGNLTLSLILEACSNSIVISGCSVGADMANKILSWVDEVDNVYLLMSACGGDQSYLTKGSILHLCVSVKSTYPKFSKKRLGSLALSLHCSAMASRCHGLASLFIATSLNSQITAVSGTGVWRHCVYQCAGLYSCWWLVQGSRDQVC